MRITKAARMGRHATAFAALAAALAALASQSCATIQQDVRYERPVDAPDLVAYEIRLAKLRLAPDAKALASLRGILADMAKRPGSETLYRARVLSLEAWAALEANDRSAARKKAEEAAAVYPADELALAALARLEKDPAKALAAFDAALASADTTWVLKAEKASVLVAAGAYREALALFDEALPRLDADRAAVYRSDRDRAYALRDAESPLSGSAATYINPDPIPLIGLIVVAKAESGLLDWYTGGVPLANGPLFDRLKGAGWFVEPTEAAQAAKAPRYKPETLATRKDVALFVWQLLSRGSASALTRYSARYASRGTSPVPDVPYGSPWFDAVLGLVEENIMTLVDGRRFEPDAPVSGLEFYAILEAAKAYR